MMTKCTCKGGKTTPGCPVCSKKDINLDSFHKLNPEAKPKTAERFKLSFAVNPQLMQRAGQIGMAGLKSSVPGMLAGGVIGGLSAEDGQGMSGAMRGAAIGGLGTGLHGAAHHAGMTGTGQMAQNYQKAVGEAGHAGKVMDRAQNIDYIRQRKMNAAPPVAAPEVKAAGYYELGKRAALTTFAI